MKMNWKIIIPILVVVMLSVGGAFYYLRERGQDEKTYQRIEVTRGDLEQTILATGVVEPRNRLEIKPPIAGRVEEVLVVEGQSVKRGDILAWMSSTERAALIDAARARGAKELKKWSQYYKATPIISPIDGMIISRSVETGQSFTSSDAILVMADTLSVKAQVDETDLSQIKVGAEAIVSLDAYRSDFLPARVTHIAYEASTVNNVTTYAVDVGPLDPPSYMRSGMTANIRFITEKRENVLLIPAEAIKIEGETYVLIPGHRPNSPQRKVIKTGLSDGKWTEVTAGLESGDIILTSELILSDEEGGAINPFGRSRGKRGAKK